jgi:hypothetical protein
MSACQDCGQSAALVAIRRESGKLMGGFAFGVPTTFISLSSVVMGAIFLTAALIDLSRKRRSGVHRRIPKALYTFAAAVILDMALMGWLGSGPFESLFIQSKSFPSLLIAGSCSLLIITVLLLRTKSGPGINPLRSGVWVLMVIAGLGIIWLIV